MTTNDTFGGSFQDQNLNTDFVPGPAISSTPVTPTDRFVPQQPASLQEASLTESLVHALILKFLYVRGTFHGREVAEQLKMSFTVVEEQLYSLKNQLLIGYRGSAVGGDYQYELSPKGVEQARRFIEHCTYFGAAPVSIPDYIESIKRQSLKNLCPNYNQVADALSDLIVNKSIISQVGQAVRAGKSLFLFGAPGNGKTSIATRLVRAVDEAIWIPRTITVGGEIVRLYDPSVHEEVPLPSSGGLLKQQDVDERWIRIKRPTVVVGGELCLKHLETNLNPVTGVIEAPIHLKSNCGCLVVDDFGRQRISTVELLNRWIVPLECGHDYLNMPSGRQLQVPFDQLVVFSTNLRPSDLCDEAF
ncbi:MAG: AAA family ATPase, partial [Pirellulaceae bacterium]